jgi:hypothetical protein
MRRVPPAWRPEWSPCRFRALAPWDKANPDAVYDPELFRRDILPRLATVKLSKIAEAAGLSKAYASDIKRGKVGAARVDVEGACRSRRSRLG